MAFQGDLLTAAYDYELPDELIAQTPAEPRDSARLLVLDRASGRVQNRRFADLVELLSPGDLLVANQSKVLPARLFLNRADSGGRVEALLLRPVDGRAWEALVRPGRRVRPGARLSLPNGRPVDVESVTAAGGRVLRFPDDPIAILELFGEMPLPPYIHAPPADPGRYQTVYAVTPGSAAAPTAGLHLTPALIERLRGRGIGFTTVTLHVGLDTFRPVQVADVRRHQIHREWCSLDEETARAIAVARRGGHRVVAVGTTSVRVLETAARASGAAGSGEIQPYSGETDLFIYPGFRFQVADALVTNFHLPRSSLLMLVSAFAGRERILATYRLAVRERYRFFSFGDAMIIQ